MPGMGSNNKPRRLGSVALPAGIVCLVLAVALTVPAGGSQAAPLSATAPGLGTAASFAVLGGSTVTNTGDTVVNGNLGVSPGSAVTGFPPGIVNGTIHAADADALQAQSDVTIAYDALAGQACDVNLTDQDLGGRTLTPGVYCFDSSAQLTGTLTLDALGDPLAVWVFQIGSTLTTASNASVLVINAGQSCNVFWQVGSSATLGTGTVFEGDILALTSITLTTSANVSGRVLARNGAVTMDTNVVSIDVCLSGPEISATQTAIAGVTETAVAAATQTAIAGVTETAVVAATGTAIVAATETAIAVATETAVGAVTGTAVVVATETAIAAATATAVALPTSTPTVVPTSPPAATATSVPVVVPTNTPVVLPTSTPVPATETAIPTPALPLVLPVTGESVTPTYGWWIVVAGLILLIAASLFRRAGQRL